jgi:small subunit ribosomal protein S20
MLPETLPTGPLVRGGSIGRVLRRQPDTLSRSYFRDDQQVVVANIKSQIKRNRQTEKRNLRNRKVRSELHTRTKNALAALDEGEDADDAVKAAIKRIDKAAQKGVLHKNTAARRKSRLARKLSAGN